MSDLVRAQEHIIRDIKYRPPTFAGGVTFTGESIGRRSLVHLYTLQRKEE